jgi:UDP-N-acetylglucosamine 2-epimerase (non-hydrolysing)
LAVRIVSVVGTRPQLIKAAALSPVLRVRHDEIFVDTGQHYDDGLAGTFYRELGLAPPDHALGVGGGSHAEQTAAMLAGLEPILVDRQPDAVLVYGDTNSTLAGALAAAKLGVPVAHVEAGLRSFDRRMPEEINRVLTDQISDLLFTTEESALGNLRREGVDAAKVHFVGNVMIDTLLAHRERARGTTAHQEIGVTPHAYALMTLHRPSNVDDTVAFERLMRGLEVVARDVPIVFPVHPRTRPSVTRSATAAALVASGRLLLVEPLGYLDFVGLMERARVVLTDSGGVQEETTILGVPCLTLRENTERPVTITHGTNRLVGTDPAAIDSVWQQVRGSKKTATQPPLWDGRAAERIVDILEGFLERH